MIGNVIKNNSTNNINGKKCIFTFIRSNMSNTYGILVLYSTEIDEIFYL